MEANPPITTALPVICPSRLKASANQNHITFHDGIVLNGYFSANDDQITIQRFARLSTQNPDQRPRGHREFYSCVC